MPPLRRSACVALAIAAAALYAAAGAAAQGAGPLIAFQSDRDGDSDIWLMNADGSNERPLTSNDTPDATPAWSPDGTTIVYACAPASRWELCAVGVAGGEVRQLTNTVEDEFDPRFLPDGTRLVLETYAADGPADIETMPAAGGGPTLLTSTPDIDDQDPAPSPDGSKIAFSSGGDISVVRPDRPGDVTPVTRASAYDSDPIWSSRNDLAFARREGRSNDVFVYTFGRTRTQRLSRGTSDYVQPAYTSDAAHVLFVRALAPDRPNRIFRMKSDGTEKTPLTEGGDFNDIEPTPQPPAAAGLRSAARAWNPVASLSCVKRYGNGGANHMTGDGERNCLYSKDGGDTIYGSGGHDTLSGGAGDDSITGGTEHDDLYGKSGNDRFWAGDGEWDKIYGGPGADEATIDHGTDRVHETAVH